MRTALYIALAVMLCSFYAVAQDYPKAEVFGGFNITHLDTEGVTVATFDLPAGSSIKNWYPGWEIAGQYNFTKLLGVKGDISGNYGTPVNIPGVTGIPGARDYSFLFGPVVSLHAEHLTPFVHALFGGNHLSLPSSTISTAGTGDPAFPGFSETAFAMAFGGGVDWKLTHHFSVRLGQFDYLYTKHCLSVPADFAGLGNAAGCLLGSNSILGAKGSAFPAHQNNFRFATGIVIH